MPTNLKPTDVVIVGMGAAGGVAALPLAQAGLKVIGLEAGTWLTPKDFAPDELRNNYRAWPQSVQKANREVPTHRPNASAPYSPRPAFHPMMNGVGGTTLHYWAQSWRLSPWDFKVVSETTKRYGASRIPAGSTVEDWPFGIEEIERYYDIAERELGVSGKAGNIDGKIDRRGNIFEAPRRREYPMPPLRWTDWHEKMAAAARSLGWNPFPGPAAINTRTYDNRPGCAYHGFCARGGCHVNAKGSTAVTTIPKAQKTGNLDIVTEAHVTEVNVDGNGRVTGVTYLEGHRGVCPAGERRAAGDLHLRERADAAVVEVEGVSQWAREQSRPGRPSLHDARDRRQRAGAVLGESQQLVRPAGARRRGRRLRRRQLRSLEASISSAAETCSCTQIGGPSTPPA